MKIEKKDIERAARALKVLRVVGEPGMDEIAIKLHCSSLTYDEERTARRWAEAFRIAESEPDLTIFDIAARVKEVMR